MTGIDDLSRIQKMRGTQREYDFDAELADDQWPASDFDFEFDATDGEVVWILNAIAQYSEVQSFLHNRYREHLAAEKQKTKDAGQ